ncbi:hypothetical protein [Aeromonas phage AS-zj]|uniref:Uncharacterized protein n=4 Tax=Caudoviricetes TaxID=2731619 RepID=A0A411B8B2_9CAUD|nr:hypothetical protein HWB28_gp301 [Aeromonas phage AS-zj]YP_009834834.1 hypothetical protein HWB29_gp132 [Aeromonas phage AS-sw]QAX97787.1 hypothetical protein ASswx1_142 [Aeromonas phage Asswx_1]UKM62821.1 hypothetical protein P19_0333 [Aeromonas phage P19]ASU00251.1 hypothetical protein [Aeromonas phage AS-zj]ATI18182.1 hypothetical protein [Aeromonas phage AS-sw]
MMNQIEVMVAEMMAFSEEVYFNKVIPDMKERFDEEHVESFVSQNLNRNSYSIMKGRKFARIVRHDFGREDTTGSVVWFVNMENGNIHKANGWASASKYVRGNVSNWKDAMHVGSRSGIYGFIAIR